LIVVYLLRLKVKVSVILTNFNIYSILVDFVGLNLTFVTDESLRAFTGRILFECRTNSIIETGALLCF